ncbi:MAG: acetylglutamate kinase [Spirochaetaceae bacterium]
MTNTTVVKIGGRAAAEEETVLELAREIRELEKGALPGAGGRLGSAAGSHRPAAGSHRPTAGSHRPATRHLLVHGGGDELSTLMERYGYTPTFRDGIRQTREEEMPLVDMALAGRMNTLMVRLFGRVGLNPVGLSAQDGGMVVGRPVVMADGTASRTGSVAGADGTLPTRLLEAGFTPVVSPVSRDETWRGLNINADEIALAVAEAIEARALIFISDIPGILDGNRVIERLTAAEAEKAIASGTISGGMIPKVRSSLAALKRGVGSITIGEYREPGDLEALSLGKKGTVLIL